MIETTHTHKAKTQRKQRRNKRRNQKNQRKSETKTTVTWKDYSSAFPDFKTRYFQSSGFLPHKKDYYVWELHDLNFSNAVSHSMSYIFDCMMLYVKLQSGMYTAFSYFLFQNGFSSWTSPHFEPNHSLEERILQVNVGFLCVRHPLFKHHFSLWPLPALFQHEESPASGPGNKPLIFFHWIVHPWSIGIYLVDSWPL